MIDAQEITVKKVQQPDFPKLLAEVVDEYHHNYLAGDAYEMYLAIGKIINSPSFSDKEQFENVIHDDFIALMFLSLPFLEENQVVRLMEKHILLGLRRNIIIEELIGRRLELFQDITRNRTETRAIAEAIARNNEVVTEGATSSGPQFTVNEWIKKLLSKHNTSKAINSLEIAQFLHKNDNLKKDGGVKVLVKRVLLLFSRVQAVYVTGIIDGLFAPLQELYLEEDRAERPTLSPPAGEKTEEEALLHLKRSYNNYRSARRPVLDAEDKLMIETKGDGMQVKRALAAASRARDKVRLIAALKVLARQGELTNALETNPAWFEATKEYVKKKYKNTAPEQEVEMAVSNLKLAPGGPTVISEFLQYLLREKASLGEHDSALVGIELGQLLGSDYMDMAYGNEVVGEFEWAKNKIQNQRLVRA